MKTLEQIKEVIENYGKLDSLVVSKIDFMKKIDSAYNTSRGIENIEFYKDRVSVTCDNSYCGCSDYIYFSFPLEYLILNDDELKIVVENDKIKRIEKEKLEEEQKKIKEQQSKDRRELEQYEKLKLKYGNL